MLAAGLVVLSGEIEQVQPSRLLSYSALFQLSLISYEDCQPRTLQSTTALVIP
jgi:hypothetical protein